MRKHKLLLSMACVLSIAGCAPNDLFFTEYGEFFIDSAPEGAMVCTTGGYCYGQTPAFIRVHEDNIVPYHAKDGCWQIEDDFILIWSSGIKHQGNFYWCGRKLKRLQYTFNRPMGGDVSEDLKQDAIVNQTMAQKQQAINGFLHDQQHHHHNRELSPYEKIGKALGTLLSNF